MLAVDVLSVYTFLGETNYYIVALFSHKILQLRWKYNFYHPTFALVNVTVDITKFILLFFFYLCID